MRGVIGRSRRSSSISSGSSESPWGSRRSCTCNRSWALAVREPICSRTCVRRCEHDDISPDITGAAEVLVAACDRDEQCSRSGVRSVHVVQSRTIARSLKRSAELSTRRKAGAYQSAMSMLNFYINRAGRTLSPKRRRILERAKSELRITFGRA
jgi:hypothetical protein